MTTTTDHKPSSNGSYILNKEQFEAKLQSWVENSLSERTRFFSRIMDPRRDLDSDCGYPDSNSLDAFYYKTLFDREPLAARVVELMPKECWQVSPMVFEDEDSEVITPFEEAWDNLSKKLRGESWFQDEEGSPIWEYLYRTDKLSGIGGFGVILLGFDDGRPLHEPLEGMVGDKPTTRNSVFQASVPYVTEGEKKFVEQANSAGKTGQLTINLSRSPKDVLERMGVEAQYYGNDLQGYQPSAYQYPSEGVYKGKERNLLFMRPFDESLVQITQFESNPFSPRYGQPVMYRITMNDITEYRGGVGLSLATIQVHWTRVIHVADNKNASEVFGVPRMRPVLNPLLDVKKVRGGSAEMYWKGAFPGVALSTHPQLGGDVPVDHTSMKDMMENYGNTLQRYLLLVGMSATTLSPTVVDPTGQITAQIEAICIQLGCPIRIFRGSERGELASTQDDSAWNDRLRQRQNMYLTPCLIVPFVDRLIKCGVLPEPTVGRSDGSKIQEEIKKLKAAGKTVEAPADPITQEAGGGKPFGGKPFGGKGGPPKAVGNYLVSSNYLVVRNAEGEVEKVLTKGGYSVQWPDLDSLGEKDKSTVANAYTTALAAYKAGGVEEVMDFKSYLVNVFRWDEEQADAVIFATQKNMLEDLEDQAELAAKAEESDLVPTPPPGFTNKPEPPPPPMPGMPVKMKDGETLVRPETGEAISPVPTKNVEEDDDDQDYEWLMSLNAFCPTGPGGGADNSCSPGYASGNTLPATVYRGGPDQESSGHGKIGGVFVSTDQTAAKNYGDVKSHSLKQTKVIDLGNWNSPAAKALVGAVHGIKPSSMSKFQYDELATELLISGQGASLFADKFKDFKGYRLGTDVFLAGRLSQHRSATQNAFCPTGPGGGMDNSCSPSSSGGASADLQSLKDAASHKDLSHEDTTLLVKHILGDKKASEVKKIVSDLYGDYGVTSKASAIDKVIRDLHDKKGFAQMADPQTLGVKTDAQTEYRPHTLAAMPRVREMLAQARASRVENVENCGGPGSGVPGPCPMGSKLKDLSAKSITADHSPEELKATMDQLGKMSVKEIKVAAKEFGLHNLAGSKGELLNRIGQKIEDRRDMFQRSQVHGVVENRYDDIEIIENGDSLGTHYED